MPSAQTQNTNDAAHQVEKGRRAKWWRRVGNTPKTFRYTDHLGKTITQRAHLEKITSLVIPPAWKHVRISPSANGKLQAVGVDADGRLQYMYHPKFSAKRQREKFARLELFGNALPRLREAIARDIRLDGLPKEKVIAVMLKLINSLYFRVGTEKSVEKYRTFGITTLQNKHLTFGAKGELVFEFVGKSHIDQRTVLVDGKLAKILKQISEIGPKRKLFHYLDEDGRPRAVKPNDLNAYLKAATEPAFSCKDLRTWGATLLAAIEFAEKGVCDDPNQIKKCTVEVIDSVAAELGNTRAVCRSSYIHPGIIEAYEKGRVIAKTGKRISANGRNKGFEPGERELIKLLRELG